MPNSDFGRVFVVSGSLTTIGGGGFSPWLLANRLAELGANVTAFTCHCHDLPPESEWTPGLQVLQPWCQKGYRWQIPDRLLVRQVVWAARAERQLTIINVGVTLHTRFLLASEVAAKTVVWENIDADTSNPLIDQQASALIARAGAMFSPAPNVDACIREGYRFEGPILRLPFWVEPQPPTGQASETLDSDFLFLARKDPYKGFDPAFAAIAALPHDTRKPTICVAGPGPDAWLKECAQKHHISEQLHIDFFRTRPAIMDALASTRCLLLPSDHEGYPLVLLEALSQGTPIIATDTGGVADMLADTLGTKVLPRHNPEAVTQAVAEVYAQVKEGVPPAWRSALQERFRQINSDQSINQHLNAAFSALNGKDNG